MRVRFHSQALIIFAALAGFAQPGFAMQITFVQVPQNRDQTETQQGLPPEKKRSLSRYGPEDVFSEQEMNDARKPRSRRKPQPGSGSNPSPALKQSAAPVVTPALQLEAATPGPSLKVAALDNQGLQPPLPQLTPSVRVVSKWTVPVLSGLALVVFAALIFVLNKLKSLLRAAG
jgi:hypothetical protein